MAFVSESCNYKNITATTTIYTGDGAILGIFVASVSGSPTIKVSDGTGTIVNTFTPVAATWYTLPFRFQTSLIVAIASTVDCTVAWCV